MSHVRRSILIKAPAEKVFAFVNDPHNLLDIWPRLTSIDRAWPAANGGQDFEWSYKWLGKRITGIAHVTEWAPGQRLALSVKSELTVECIFEFQPIGGSVHVSLHLAFAVPTPTVKTLVETIVLGDQRRELEIVLTNLKMRQEWDWRIPRTYAIINSSDVDSPGSIPPDVGNQHDEEEDSRS